MHRLTARASQDVRMDEPLADACFEDRSRLCDGVQPVRSHAPRGRLDCRLACRGWGSAERAQRGFAPVAAPRLSTCPSPVLAQEAAV